jgi:hypothetical protein
MKFGWRDEMEMKSLVLEHSRWHSGPNKKYVDSLPIYTVVGDFAYGVFCVKIGI